MMNSAAHCFKSTQLASIPEVDESAARHTIDNGQANECLQFIDGAVAIDSQNRPSARLDSESAPGLMNEPTTTQVDKPLQKATPLLNLWKVPKRTYALELAPVAEERSDNPESSDLHFGAVINSIKGGSHQDPVRFSELSVHSKRVLFDGLIDSLLRDFLPREQQSIFHPVLKVLVKRDFRLQSDDLLRVAMDTRLDLFRLTNRNIDGGKMPTKTLHQLLFRLQCSMYYDRNDESSEQTRKLYESLETWLKSEYLPHDIHQVRTFSSICGEALTLEQHCEVLELGYLEYLLGQYREAIGSQAAGPPANVESMSLETS
mgnify:CR=1 FL=1